jgi:hypothetical protein
VSEFKGATRGREVDATTATAHLPGLDIEIVHRRLPDGDAEQILISLQATPSFEAFGRDRRRAQARRFRRANLRGRNRNLQGRRSPGGGDCVCERMLTSA